MAAKVVGLEDLNRKVRLMKSNFDGPPLKRLCLNGARSIAAEGRRNLRQIPGMGNTPGKGPTGNLMRAIQAVSGKKASKYGAVAIARVNAWIAPHAHLITEGTKERTGLMKIPLARVPQALWTKLSGAARTAAGRRGFLFFRRVKGVTASHFWDKAVEAKLPGVQKAIEAGCKKIVEDSIR